MNYNVTLKELPQRTVASVRKVIPSYEREGMLWGILMKEIGGQNIQDGEPCYTLAIFHDGEHINNTNINLKAATSYEVAAFKNELFYLVKR